MVEQNLTYITNLKIKDVPWYRLSCSYGTAELFAQILNTLAKAVKKSKFDEKELSELLDDIFGECEYQETFWHATPFALVFLVRIYKSTLGEKGEAAKFISRKLEEFFKFMLEICEKVEQMDHAKPLTKMEQMLEPKYLDIVDQDELSYDDRLFYSFYYYSRMVLRDAFVKI
ncbi:ATP-dependent DNA helicase RuvA [Campylobacter concisus]|uniref:ATP-dependent DNA helicase RuvA n=1 Tax=Campylobacter concisus TaxID=199 RepID=UPI000CD9F3C6|nr:ATP-dependent DNA helicase RuvA [Campylobacter concisus]